MLRCVNDDLVGLVPRVEKCAFSPRTVFTWPVQALIADPVMKVQIAGRGMKPTMNPRRSNSKNNTIAPQMIARAGGTGGGVPGGERPETW